MGYVPESLIEPFLKNNVISIILLALLIGAAIRQFKHQSLNDDQSGLSDALIMTAVPLISTVDWIIARCRSGMNVMNDMLIGILLERLESSER